MKQDPYWFFKKWGFQEALPMDEIYERLAELEQRVIKLEDENIGMTNALYELENSLDARIDIIAERCGIQYDV
jgi:hypothetical protein